MLRFAAVSVFVVLAMALAGCTSHSGGGKNAAPVSPDSVQFYTRPPAGSYETLGWIELPVTPDIRWDDQSESPKGIAMLKEKAAAMGANGILTDLKTSDYNLKALVGDGKGNWYQIPLRTSGSTRTAVAIAIKVP